jgi:hypothetical protein
MTDKIEKPGSTAPAVGAEEPAELSKSRAQDFVKQRLALSQSPEFIEREAELRRRVSEVHASLVAARQDLEKQSERLSRSHSESMINEEHSIVKEIRALEYFPDGLTPELEQRALRFILLERFRFQARAPVRLAHYRANTRVQECAQALDKAVKDLAAHINSVGNTTTAEEIYQQQEAAAAPKETAREATRREGHENWLKEQNPTLRKKSESPGEDAR